MTRDEYTVWVRKLGPHQKEFRFSFRTDEQEARRDYRLCVWCGKYQLVRLQRKLSMPCNVGGNTLDYRTEMTSNLESWKACSES